MYSEARKLGPIVEAACWTHGRRKPSVLSDVMKAPPEIEAVRRIDAIFDMDRVTNCPVTEQCLAKRQVRAARFTSRGQGMRGERAAAMYSLIVTARLNDIYPRARVADELARIADHPVQRLRELLPWELEEPEKPKCDRRLSKLRRIVRRRDTSMREQSQLQGAFAVGHQIRAFNYRPR